MKHLWYLFFSIHCTATAQTTPAITTQVAPTATTLSTSTTTPVATTLSQQQQQQHPPPLMPFTGVPPMLTGQGPAPTGMPPPPFHLFQAHMARMRMPGSMSGIPPMMPIPG